MEITPLGPDDLKPVMILENQGFALGKWSVGSWSAELDGPGRLVLGAKEDGQLLGVASFSSMLDTTELLRIVVAPEQRRRGIGRALLEQGLGCAKTHAGASRVLLEVERTNKPAVRMYEKAGFREISRRKDYYGPGADALIMERKLA